MFLLPMNRPNNRILHVDGDSFFASCEIALDSSLEGRPVWVGGGRRGDGIVIAANRIAKKYGIKTGTACFEAKRLCPSGVLCKPHYDASRCSIWRGWTLTQLYGAGRMKSDGELWTTRHMN